MRPPHEPSRARGRTTRPGRCAAALALALLAACGDATEEGAAPNGSLRSYPPAEPLRPRDLDPPGFWNAGGEDEGLWARTPTVSPEEAAGALEDIGYAQGFEAAPVESGVFVRDPARVQPGPNLYVSGHAPEAILMGAGGEVLHRWSYAYGDLSGAPDATAQQAGCWRRAAVRADGRLYAIYEGVGLVALERDSTLRWFHAGGEHHDLALLPGGGLVTLARRSRVVPELHAEYPVLEDQLLWLDEQGREQRRVSLLEAWRRSAFAELFDTRPYLVGDVTHTNSLEVLDGRLAGALPAFAAGNLLLSSRMLDTVFVVDPVAERVVWARRGPWVRQHDPSVTDAGTLLVFDNRGYRGSSQVLEVDLVHEREVWAWRGDPPSAFDSIFLGAAQRLANGNTLVTEGCAGRAFEVAPDGAVVWEFVSPHRAGEAGELVAALFDVVRLPAGFGAGW